MKELMRNSVNVSGRTEVCWPQLGNKEEIIDMSGVGSEFNGCYATNNSTICFVVDHEVFVTPYTYAAMITIEEAGLVKRDFYVPFSNWDYPKNGWDEWQRLCKLATESCYRYEVG